MTGNSYYTYKIILKQIGAFSILLGLIMVFPLVVSLIYSELHSATGFLLSGLIIECIGIFLYRFYYRAEEPQYNHVLIMLASGWFGVAILGSLPFLLISYLTPIDIMNRFIPADADYTFSSIMYFRNPLHCLFESMSGYTTTGLTMAVHEPSLGRGLLFYRSFSQWVGGGGFIIMVLAIFKEISGRSAILLYGTEASGEKFKPRVIETARLIWKVYLIVTVFSAIYLFIGTRLILPAYPLVDTVFDSLNHALTGQSTGGFSTLDDSIAGYQSSKMEILYLFPMILGAFSIPFYYKLIFQGKISELWNDIQTRSLIIAFILGSFIQAYLLYYAGNISDPLRSGIFQFISAMSTTGWQTSDIGGWDWMSVVFIISAMFIGGASGSTVGGIKMIRALIIKRVLRWQINSVFLSKNTIKSVRFNHKLFPPEEMYQEFTNATSLAIMVLGIIFISAFITFFASRSEYDFVRALFESASAQGTVGLSVGIVQPSMSPLLEIVYIIQMWAGRLEVIPVIALFRALSLGIYPKNI